MRLDCKLINTKAFAAINVGARGGAENLISQALPSFTRKSTPLYDYVFGEMCVEVKKQKNLQWFDLGKYSNLSDADLNIIMLFVMHKKGVVCRVAVTSLKEFLDWLLLHKAGDGWNKEVINRCALWKDKYPRLQTKAPVKILGLLEQAPQIFDIIF